MRASVFSVRKGRYAVEKCAPGQEPEAAAAIIRARRQIGCPRSVVRRLQTLRVERGSPLVSVDVAITDYRLRKAEGLASSCFLRCCCYSH